MGWNYSEKTKQLFLDAVHGKPGTHLGEVADADGVGEHGSVACGDALKFSFRVEKNADPLKDVIVEARYLTFGCTSAIAASEALCCIIEDKRVTPIEALSITNADIVEFLEGLPEQKIHCSVMGAEALAAAVFDWAKKRGVKLSELGLEAHTPEEDEGRMVCKCFGITEPYLRRKIKELNLRTIPEITGAIKAGGGCMNCHHAPGGLQDILDDVWGKSPENRDVSQDSTSKSASGASGGFVPLATISTLDQSAQNAQNAQSKETAQPSQNSQPADSAALSPYQRAKKIEKQIDSYIRPMIRKDGGDLEIIDIKDTLVFVRLTGACENCATAGQTLKFLVENVLKTRVDEAIRVIQV